MVKSKQIPRKIYGSGNIIKTKILKIIICIIIILKIIIYLQSNLF